jgi:tight adherence protein B
VGALLGLSLGVGLLLIWRGRSAPAAESPRWRGGWLDRRSELLRQSGVDGVGSLQLGVAQVLCALVVGGVALAVTETVTVAACFAAFAFVVPVLVLRRLRRRRQVVLRDLWPEAIDNLASAVRAGLSLPEGVSALALRGPEPLRAPFARFSAAYRASGRFSDCLDRLKHDLSDPVGDRICETLRLAREVGGNDVGTVLRTLSELLRSDARIRAEVVVDRAVGGAPSVRRRLAGLGRGGTVDEFRIEQVVWGALGLLGGAVLMLAATRWHGGVIRCWWALERFSASVARSWPGIGR